jgi:hypothetical protein
MLSSSSTTPKVCAWTKWTSSSASSGRSKFRTHAQRIISLQMTRASITRRSHTLISIVSDVILMLLKRLMAQQRLASKKPPLILNEDVLSNELMSFKLCCDITLGVTWKRFATKIWSWSASIRTEALLPLTSHYVRLPTLLRSSGKTVDAC